MVLSFASFAIISAGKKHRHDGAPAKTAVCMSRFWSYGMSGGEALHDNWLRCGEPATFCFFLFVLVVVRMMMTMMIIMMMMMMMLMMMMTIHD
eukprot:1006698-Amphidinium_carterae.1